MKRLFSALGAMVVVFLMALPGLAKDIISNQWEQHQLIEMKFMIDDPRPFFTNLKKLAGEENWKRYITDVDKAKAVWADVVGFTAPEVVGKIAPEIKPGKYTLADKTRLPFDKLMPKVIYERYNEPGQFAGNITEFEIVDTQQYYHHLGVGDNTKANDGSAKLDADGYMDYATLKLGYPFARPSGPQKADQIVYNSLIESQHLSEEFAEVVVSFGFNKKLQMDFQGGGKYYQIKLANRSKLAPLGAWYDARAEKSGENKAYFYEATKPRDLYGNAFVNLKYQNPKKNNIFLFYTTMTRRVRKLSSSDTQDQSIGSDSAYDDVLMFDQKYRPDLYAYDVKLLAETEILIPAYSHDGSEYADSTAGFQWRNVRMERRPVWVIEMDQQDTSYIYSKRIIYVDRETYVPLLSENYDQKGRLWRTMQICWAFIPEVGQYTYWQTWQYDYIDVHTTLDTNWEWLPADTDRSQFSPKKLMRMVK
ncbi:MAG: DUF1329 domain-containing protein [Deltaproteobacteria bacterium]|nr:DUF1329 domain-containing protein [Deltaproteobacteria bacterium]